MSGGNKNLVGSLLLGGALFLAAGFSFSGFQQVRNLQAAVQERTDLLAARTETLSKLKNFGLEYDQREDEVAPFIQVLPNDKGTAELIAAIENIAAGSGVQLDSVSITAPEGGIRETIPSLTVSIGARGAFASMTAFTGNIESNLRLLDVESVEANTESGRGNVLLFSIRAKAYFLRK